MVLEASVHEKLDEVDTFLASQDGQIVRPRDPQKCRHNARQKCSYCLPIDPYDEEYLKEKEIKHMSFHSYIRKLTEGRGKGSLKKPLENVTCKINLNCPEHKPYPKGICTKCRPATVTLNRQRYRHVDNISIENEDLVNNFLNFWRSSSHQRVGYLIGKYQPFADVPLGIKAVVAAIYEPPQTTGTDGVELLDDPNEAAVDRLCNLLGLKRLGWIFTDLWNANRAKGLVHCTRHANSFLLTAEECITAAHFQLKYPNVTEYCTDGSFGSKFVTLVASGDESEHINFHGYQVSNQCSSLVEADLLCPTNYPELAYVRDTPLHEQHYLPDVQFTEKNEYGAEVRRDGRPLPVEFLMVDVPAGMPKDPQYTFHVNRGGRFHIENREAIGEMQDGQNLSRYCELFSLNQFIEQASDFHFLLYLLTQKTVKFTEAEIASLCEAVREQDRGKAMDWATKCANWTSLVAHGHSQGPTGGPSGQWSCKHCTFENTEDKQECAMCGLPANT